MFANWSVTDSMLDFLGESSPSSIFSSAFDSLSSSLSGSSESDWSYNSRILEGNPLHTISAIIRFDSPIELASIFSNLQKPTAQESITDSSNSQLKSSSSQSSFHDSLIGNTKLNTTILEENVVTSEPSTQRLAQIAPKTDFQYDRDSNNLIPNIYKRPSRFYQNMASSGAYGANASWESNQTDPWYIEEQRAGEDAILGGLINMEVTTKAENSAAIQAGFKMFDWGFARQASDGSFLGTGDAFQSTSLFVAAVAHTLLEIQDSPQASQYRTQIEHYKPLVHRAARWMIEPSVLSEGLRRNQPFTHRCYVVACALGLTARLTGDRELGRYARQSIDNGLSLQRPDGVNPERGGFDSSYQAEGVRFAERWVTNFPNDSLAPKVRAMIGKALTWEATRILPSGEISSEGNTRTGGQETNYLGNVKQVGPRTPIRVFSYWGAVTGEQKWNDIARRIADFYY